jgi:RNA polymerase sigma-70 factor (ECF subfamily)
VKRESKEEQFNQIVSEQRGRIERICSYYTANKQERQEIFQEVLINIWKGIDRFRGESAIGTWIYRIAVNTAISHIGKVNKYLKFSIHIDPQHIKPLFDEQTPQEREEQEAQYERLQSELNLLSIIDKTLISLMMEGLSTKEIAEVVGITEPNVRVKIHRIKSELKTIIKGEHHGNE